MPIRPIAADAIGASGGGTGAGGSERLKRANASRMTAIAKGNMSQSRETRVHDCAETLTLPAAPELLWFDEVNAIRACFET